MRRKLKTVWQDKVQLFIRLVVQKVHDKSLKWNLGLACVRRRSTVPDSRL